MLLPLAATAAGQAPPQSPVSAESRAGEQVIPAEHAARALIGRLKAALEQNRLLARQFYSPDQWAGLLGPHYTFRPQPAAGEAGAVAWNFDELGNVYVDEAGHATRLGRQRPLLTYGSLGGTLAGAGRRGHISFAAVTAARTADNATFFADTVVGLLGSPSEVRSGGPSFPPMHGRPYVPEPEVHSLANRWLTWQLDDARHTKFIRIRTLGDGAVAELQFDVQEK
ncbi:hypothetical protein [Pseudoduganella ginsengisoli]|uniref:Uncharacterized protein n=1 Tax=Pseudoduganella ginsengisoli TaxID=1462440 RepID=A0A6L6Q2P7_9BURK|nr:hypothetical protein [Pseudoduganella ginsengisoli]MTW03885.1 hypothetical protein [Pseudoduganella ginsengisoli]